jgi:hypothetical protein
MNKTVVLMSSGLKTAYSYEIVGAHYRPPAQAILEVLPIGAKLILRQEPDHPKTRANAIGVWIKTEEFLKVDKRELISALASSGFTLDEVCDLTEHQLGYIPAIFAEKMDIGTEDIEGELIFDLNNKLKVSFKA